MESLAPALVRALVALVVAVVLAMLLGQQGVELGLLLLDLVWRREPWSARASVKVLDLGGL